MLFLCYPKCSTCQKAKKWLDAMDRAGQLALLAGDGMLVKRPILVDGDTVLVGFREADWAAALG